MHTILNTKQKWNLNFRSHLCSKFYILCFASFYLWLCWL